jgi:sulfur carrier protein
MKITLNNREDEIDDQDISISKLLEIKNFTFRMLVIKVNGKLVRKEEYSSTFIREGDDVMVLHMISGG